jgi:PHD/YefM family antitoxin component YafN of YafNO toxin-antitoxin module
VHHQKLHLSHGTAANQLQRFPLDVSDVKREGWRGVMNVVDASGKVLMTNHDRPEAVIMSLREYRLLTELAERVQRDDQSKLEQLTSAFDAELAVLRQPDAGDRLRRAGMAWFNRHTYARALVQGGMSADEADVRAWQHGVDLIDQAVAAGISHAFETTLGGSTMAHKIAGAARTHDVLVWYCGLPSPEQHIARVAAPRAAGGHDIPEAKIRERWVRSPLNLIDLMPDLSELRVFDNSVDAAPGDPVTAPVPVLHVQAGAIKFPLAFEDLERTPGWAKPIVKAARDFERKR